MPWQALSSSGAQRGAAGRSGPKKRDVSKVTAGMHEKLRLGLRPPETGGSRQKNRDVSKVIRGGVPEKLRRRVGFRAQREQRPSNSGGNGMACLDGPGRVWTRSAVSSTSGGTGLAGLDS
jgi:hypothetical protein